MLDFTKIQDITMEYTFKQYSVTNTFSEAPGANSRVLSQDQNTLRFTICDDDRANDIATYQMILTKNGGKLLIKGDFFEAPEQWWETSVVIRDDCVEIVSEDDSEKMLLTCFFG